MPDFREEIRSRLARLRIAPAREAEIVDELSQHLDDEYREARSRGLNEEDASGAALNALSDHPALARALASWGLDAGDEAGFERMVAAETETLILHELGEARAGGLLGERWEEMLAALSERRAELLARAVRDNLADCLSTLPGLLEREAGASIHFYFSQFDGLRRELFPALTAAYREWRESGAAGALRPAIERGSEHWASVARRLLARPVPAGGGEARALAL